jgi:hypothetical protein
MCEIYPKKGQIKLAGWRREKKSVTGWFGGWRVFSAGENIPVKAGFALEIISGWLQQGKINV